MNRSKYVFAGIGLLTISLLSGCFLFDQKNPQFETVSVEGDFYVVLMNTTDYGIATKIYCPDSQPLASVYDISGNVYPQSSLPEESYMIDATRLLLPNRSEKTVQTSKLLFNGSGTTVDYGTNPSNWVVGTTERTFNVYAFSDGTPRPTSVTFVLRSVGNVVSGSFTKENDTYCYVFVDKNIPVSIATHIATNISKRFDGPNGVYKKLVGLFERYERGGGESGDGGADKNRNVIILITDIQDGYDGVTSKGFIGGYFDPFNTEYEGIVLDYYPMISNTNVISFDLAFSTLIHEGTHMVTVWGGKENVNAWLLEALAMAGEEVIGNNLGLTDSVQKLYKIRFETYQNNIDRGLTTWNSLAPLPDYAKSFAFMSFLVRNHGARVLNAIANYPENLSGVSIVQNALRNLGINFISAYENWRKSIIFKKYPGRSESTDIGSVSIPEYTFNGSIGPVNTIPTQNQYETTISGWGCKYYAARATKKTTLYINRGAIDTGLRYIVVPIK